MMMNNTTTASAPHTTLTIVVVSTFSPPPAHFAARSNCGRASLLELHPQKLSCNRNERGPQNYNHQRWENKKHQNWNHLHADLCRKLLRPLPPFGPQIVGENPQRLSNTRSKPFRLDKHGH